MNTRRRQARDYLNQLPLDNFWDVVRQAKISDDDQKILDLRFVHGWTINKISQETNYSVEKINDVIKKAYDKIASLL